MQILPNEIDTVDRIGILDGDEVKMVRTVGGLYLAVGKLKGKKQDEVLAAGSHAGIVKYNIQKSFPAFQPAMEKSEKENEEVSGLSELLPKNIRNQGFDLFSSEKNGQTSLIITKHNMEVGSCDLVKKENNIMLSSNGIVPNGVGKAIAIAAAREAVKQGLDQVIFEDKTFSTGKIIK